MQRAARCFALAYFALTTVACLDQARRDESADALEHARDEGAREGRLQAVERQQAFLLQQIASLSAQTNSTTALTSAYEDERDKRLDDVSAQLTAITQLLSAWREEEKPQQIDPEARRVAEQASAEDRAAAIRKVQALIDAGRIKLTMRGGRIQLAQVRPIDITNPYEPAPAKPIPTPPPPPPLRPPLKTPVDRLGF